MQLVPSPGVGVALRVDLGLLQGQNGHMCPCALWNWLSSGIPWAGLWAEGVLLPGIVLLWHSWSQCSRGPKAYLIHRPGHSVVP